MKRLALLVAAAIAPCSFADPAAPLAAPPSATPSAACQILIKETLPLEFDDTGRVSIPVLINDKPHRMMVDTGDYYSIITRRAADDLGLKVEVAGNFMLWGWGGRRIYNVTDVDSFAIGRQRAGKTSFMVANWYGINDGLLGADFLYYFDLDFDFAKSKLRLISPEHCKGKVVHWSKGDYGTVPFAYDERKIRIKVTLDGKQVEAIVDTGADDTVMSMEEAADLFGWDEDDLASGKKKPSFGSLSFGSVGVTSPSIRLVSDEESVLLDQSGPKMIIGMTVLRRLHVYIAYAENVMYVTPATQY